MYILQDIGSWSKHFQENYFSFLSKYEIVYPKFEKSINTKNYYFIMIRSRYTEENNINTSIFTL